MDNVSPVNKRFYFLDVVGHLVQLSFTTIPVKTVSSAYLSVVLLLCVALQSDVYNEKRKGDKTVPWGVPVLVTITSDAIDGFDLTN